MKYGLRSAIAHLQIEGLGAFLLRAFQIFLRLFYYDMKAELLSLDFKQPFSFSHGKTSLQIDKLADGDIKALSKITMYDESEIQRRLHRGQFCMIAKVDGNIVHYSWVTREVQQADEIESTLQFQPGCFYIYNCRTLKKFRGLGIFPSVLGQIIHETKARGASKAYALVTSMNHASKRSFSKLHFLPEREFRVTRILFWYFGKHQNLYRI